MSVKKATLTGLTTDSGTSGDFITNDNTLVFNGTDQLQNGGSNVLGIWILGGTYLTRTFLGSVNLGPGQTTWSFDFQNTSLPSGNYTISLTDSTTNTANVLST